MSNDSQQLLIQRLTTRMVRVANAVANLSLHNEIYWEVQEIIRSNKSLNNMSSHFFQWMRFAYIESACIAVRRQVDATKGTVSLLRVLEEIRRNRTLFTEEYFLNRRSFESESVLYELTRTNREEAAKDFNEQFGKGQVHLARSVILSDIELLKSKTNLIKEFAQRIAHELENAEIPESEKPNGFVLADCIECLDQLTRKYFYLLTATKLAELKFQFMYDWKAIFTLPWIERNQQL